MGVIETGRGNATVMNIYIKKMVAISTVYRDMQLL